MARRKKEPELVLTEVSRKRYYEGEVIYENEDTVSYMEIEKNYGGCYYEGDEPSIETYIVLYKKSYK